MQIRAYRDGDAPALAHIYHMAVHELGTRRYSPEQVVAWSPNPPDPARFVARAADGRDTLVAVEDDDRAVAFGDLEADGHIDLLYCAPDHAGTGTADILLQAILARANERGCDRLYVEASDLARGLLERHGFVHIERRDFMLNGVAIHNHLLQRIGR